MPNPYQNSPQFQPAMPQQQMPSNRTYIFTGNAAQGGTFTNPGSNMAIPQSMYDTMNPTYAASQLTNNFTQQMQQGGMGSQGAMAMWQAMQPMYQTLQSNPAALPSAMLAANQMGQANRNAYAQEQAIAQPHSRNGGVGGAVGRGSREPRIGGAGSTIYGATDEPQQIRPPSTGGSGYASRPMDSLTGEMGEIVSFLQQMAQQYGIDPDAFYRQIELESAGFDPEVIAGRRHSSAGAQGIAQFMPATAQRFGVNPSDWRSSLEGAGKYMQTLMEYFKGNPRAATAAYNAGEGTVGDLMKRYGAHWEQYLPGETKKYLEIIYGNGGGASIQAMPQMQQPMGGGVGAAAGMMAPQMSMGGIQGMQPIPNAVPGQYQAVPIPWYAGQQAQIQPLAQVGPAGRSTQQIMQSNSGYASLEERQWFLSQLGAILSPNGVPMLAQGGMPAMQPQGVR